MNRRRLLQVGLLVAGLAPAWSAFAQPERLDARLSYTRVDSTDWVNAQFSVTQVFTEAFRRRLAGGLKSRAVLAVDLLDAKGRAIVIRRRKCELKLDVWDDKVYVRIRDEQRLDQRIFVLIENALRACGRVDIPVIPLERLTAREGYRIRVRVALNPVSPELLERSRQFTSNPSGSASGRPQAFFGAVARWFRSESDAGGTVFVFQSGRLARPSAEASLP